MLSLAGGWLVDECMDIEILLVEWNGLNTYGLKMY